MAMRRFQTARRRNQFRKAKEYLMIAAT
jgi:hypothetical protein